MASQVSFAHRVLFPKTLVGEWEPKLANLECEQCLMRLDMAIFNVFQKLLRILSMRHSHSQANQIPRVLRF